MNVRSDSVPSRPDARRVILAMNVSVDGFVGGPDGDLDWLWPTMDPEMSADVVEFLQGVDTVLIGHETYLGQAAQWPNQSDPMADLLNSHTKIVFSTRLETLDWSNSRLAEDDVEGVVAELKSKPGKNIFVTGGATLARSMSQAGLIDEYRVNIHPTLLGSGKPLFAEAAELTRLHLAHTRTYDSGAILAHYRRIQAEEAS